MYVSLVQKSTNDKLIIKTCESAYDLHVFQNQATTRKNDDKKDFYDNNSINNKENNNKQK